MSQVDPDPDRALHREADPSAPPGGDPAAGRRQRQGTPRTEAGRLHGQVRNYAIYVFCQKVG